MKKILMVLLLLVPLSLSAQPPYEVQTGGELTFDLVWNVVTTDDNTQISIYDTAWFNISRNSSSMYWRSLLMETDTVFTTRPETLHVLFEHSPSLYNTTWIVWDSVNIITDADSLLSYYDVSDRIEIDSAYIGNYWRIRIWLGKVAPETTEFDEIDGNTYNFHIRYFIEAQSGHNVD